MSKFTVEILCLKMLSKILLVKKLSSKKFVETCDEKFLTFQMNHAIINYADFVDICRKVFVYFFDKVVYTILEE